MAGQAAAGPPRLPSGPRTILRAKFCPLVPWLYGPSFFFFCLVSLSSPPNEFNYLGQKTGQCRASLQDNATFPCLLLLLPLDFFFFALAQKVRELSLLWGKVITRWGFPRFLLLLPVLLSLFSYSLSTFLRGKLLDYFCCCFCFPFPYLLYFFASNSA